MTISIIRTPSELSAASAAAHRKGQRVALVPTMGNLHEGHLSLVKLACETADTVIVSIFVNPTQFGPNEDFSAYPRTFAEDLEKLESVASKEIAVYHPEVNALYADTHSTWVNEEMLSLPLCGASRPGHFRGVTTVVAKLFNAARPDVAVFGQKDAQQALVIQRMIRDLDYPIAFILAPIVRESDGLAMSSRNRYLSPDDRRKATIINVALNEVKSKLGNGEFSNPAAVQTYLRERITQGGGTVDYIEIVDPETLAPATTLNGGLLIPVAVRFGTTRLLDNLLILKD